MNIADKTLWVVSRNIRFTNTPEGLLLLDFERRVLPPGFTARRGLAADQPDPLRNHGEGDRGFARNTSPTSETHTRGRNVQIGGVNVAKTLRSGRTAQRDHG